MNGNEITFIPWRFSLLILFLIFVVFGLAARVFSLAVFEQHFLQQQGNERTLRLVKKPAFRGMILDRNQYPLAVSASVFSVWINPQEFKPTSKQVLLLSKLLNLKSKNLIKLMEQNKQTKREFIYLKRNISPELAQQAKNLNVNGLYLQEGYKRFYAEGETTAHVIGFTNVDDQGQEGLELVYNNWLQGEPGKKWVTKDRLGRIIADLQVVQEQKPGKDLIVSIDRRLQYLAYRELLKGVMQNQAREGSVVVLDIQSGEVLAMVNHPSYNPNNRSLYNPSVFRNRAVTDIFEPGSTIKAFSIASALDTGHYQPDTLVNTSPGWMRVDHHVVQDEKNFGPLTVTQILQVSSNVGVTKIILNLAPDQLWSLLSRLGFGEITGIGFPGEQNGSLVKHYPWGSFTLATLAFGYGLSVSTLQLARAYAVIGSQGIKKPVSLLKLEQNPSGERVMEASVAQKVLDLLEAVVSNGTGKLAQLPGYRIAGKTGTAKMARQGGYEKHRYIASFVGIAPVNQPRIVVAVVIHDPQGKHYSGGKVAAPIFKKIMEGALRILDVPPDNI